MAIRRERARKELDIDDFELTRDEPPPPLPAEVDVPRFEPLRALLDPLDEGTFVREWLGRDVLHLAGRGRDRAHAHHELLTLEGFLDGLRTHRVPTHSVAFHGGKEAPRHDKDVVEYDRRNFTVGDGSCFHYGRLRDYLDGAKGSMIVFDAGRWFPSIRAFEDGLAEVTGSHVRTTAFYAPPGGHLYPPHWDAHDVLAVQLHGRKHWRCWEPVLEAPLRERTHMQSTPYPGFEEGLDHDDRVLEEGDVLYLPAGRPHAVRTGDRPSLHLTFAILQPRWHQLFESIVARALSECEQDLDFRRPCRAMTIGSAHPRVSAQRDRLQRRLAAAIDAVDLDEVLAEHFARRPRSLPSIRPEPEAVEIRTRLRRPPQLLIVREGAGGADLLLGDERLSFPSTVAPALRWLRGRRHLYPCELPGLDEHEQLVVARRLVAEGVLVPDDDHGTTDSNSMPS